MTPEELNAIRQIVREELSLQMGNVAYTTTAGYPASVTPYTVTLLQCAHEWQTIDATVSYSQCRKCHQRNYHP